MMDNIERVFFVEEDDEITVFDQYIDGYVSLKDCFRTCFDGEFQYLIISGEEEEIRDRDSGTMEEVW